MKNLPTQTAEIFKRLSRGEFINADSPDREVRQLFTVMEEEVNFELLDEYFRHLQFHLERGEGYFYFSRPETRANLERKIERAYEWIDLLDFFKTFHTAFGSGFRFSPAEILTELKTNVDLENKLEGLKSQTGKETHADILEKVLKKMRDDCFIEIENSITGQYKVLSSFSYLEQLILAIHISTPEEDEIPK